MSRSRPFRFGILNERAHTLGAWTALAHRAESLGYATLLMRDHFVREPFGDQLAPVVAAGTPCGSPDHLMRVTGRNEC